MYLNCAFIYEHKNNSNETIYIFIFFIWDYPEVFKLCHAILYHRLYLHHCIKRDFEGYSLITHKIYHNHLFSIRAYVEVIVGLICVLNRTAS